MSFQITIAPSGRVFDTAIDETILQAGLRQNIPLPYGCKDGACGSCKCKKISGIVIHDQHQSKALSDEEELQGYVLTCCAHPQSDVKLESKQVGSADAFPIKKLPSRVIAHAKLSQDVMQITLQLPASEAFQFHAGQYVEFILRDGARRSYSMANAPRSQTASDGSILNNTIDLHVRHMPGGKFTDQVFSSLKEKDILRLEGPMGGFRLDETSDQAMVFLASGTGFAPIKAIIEHMQAKGITRQATLYWGGRRPDDLYLDAWVRAQLNVMPNLCYVPVISDALPQDAWTGRTGFVHEAVMQDFPDLSGHQVYACGAPVVIESAQADFVGQCQLPLESFFADAFTSEADKAKV